MSSSIKNSNRDIGSLNPLVQVMTNLAIYKMKSVGIDPLVVETYRSKKRQYYLYGQGRTAKQCINAGMAKKYANKYARDGNILTWILKSNHIYKTAIDIVPIREGKAIWDSSDEETKKIIKIMKSMGFEAGANWKNNPNSQHFQVAGISSSGRTFKEKNANKHITKVVQKKLKKLGYYNGKVDGIWGKNTKQSIKDYKKVVKRKRNAKVGTKMLKELLKI